VNEIVDTATGETKPCTFASELQQAYFLPKEAW
jgi:hypothetical protein